MRWTPFVTAQEVNVFQLRKELMHMKDELTEREKEVLTWVARGKTAWEIATILHLSRRTVEWYITQARIRLNAATMVQAVVQAMKTKQISPAFISYGSGVVTFGATLAIKIMRWWDWIGPPGGVA
jgi:DNA-binding CsgD family transcriptional regulator